jgi:hypothetical protein
MWNMYNRMKPPYFSLISFGSGFGSGFESGFENVYFGSGSDPDPAKSFVSLRIRIRIRNTGWSWFIRSWPGFRLLSEFGSWSKSRFFITKNCKILQFQKNSSFFIHRPLLWAFSYLRSLKPPKKNIQHLKLSNFFTFFCFCSSFLPSWIQIQSGYGSETWWSFLP